MPCVRPTPDTEVCIMLGGLTKYLRPEIAIEKGDELRAGPARITGVGESGSLELVTPFRGRKCLAYVYRVLRVVETRGGKMPSVVRERVCEAPFHLVLADGTRLKALPKRKNDPVTPEEHREMISAGEEGVYFDESVVPVGHKVKVTGMLTRSGDEWEVSFSALEDLGAPAPVAGKGPGTSRRKRRRGN